MQERLGEMEREKRKGAIVSSSPQGITSWSSSFKIWFFLAYRMHYYNVMVLNRMQKNVPLVNRM